MSDPDYFPLPDKPTRPTKKERRRLEIYAKLNEPWKAGSANQIVDLVYEFLEDQMDGG